ncbi:helix-turn-helix domain-containing protein [Halorubrum vacuolatum]|uniref:Predicted DNA binding protein, contains HTH domain n=1 Tax=Halorubrum vacuolatum TaxID=63740 RepID=A0A238WU35_HALVU|nr:helix-turn-helix domain-containing protein [Halorubrum vacuolatum]SNR50060.1 Predicted DNA binding protein, contains HTH domain [Halorubrum vacuolatum]
MGSLSTAASSGARLTLELWHPNCWTLEVTMGAPGGLLAHTVYNATDGRVKGHFTVYGSSIDEIESLIEETRASPLTESVVVMQRRTGYTDPGSLLGYATRELFVEYDPVNTISDALASRGFIQDGPVRVSDGIEHWSVFVSDTDRERLHERLDKVAETQDAEITVTKITTRTNASTSEPVRLSLLSPRQREVFELACEHGYYSWPREVTTRELAEKAGISKTTLLEHLRKSEAKLLGPAIERMSTRG